MTLDKVYCAGSYASGWIALAEPSAHRNLGGPERRRIFIIYFPGLVNWSVGENKELNFLVAAAAAVVGVVVAVAVAAVVDACLYVV